MGYYNPCYHPIPPCLHCHYAWCVQQYHLQQQQALHHAHLQQHFPVTGLLTGGPWDQGREHSDLKFDNPQSIRNSFNNHVNGDFQYSASKPQSLHQPLPTTSTDTLRHPQAAKSPNTLPDLPYQPQNPTDAPTIHALQTQNHHLTQEIARLQTALNTLPHTPKAIEPTPFQLPHSTPTQHPQNPDPIPDPSAIPTTSTAGSAGKKGTYTHFSATIQKTTPWLTPYLPLLNPADDYSSPSPTTSKSNKDGKKPQHNRKRCRVGRPLGKVLSKAHSDDLARGLCSKHRSREEFEIASGVAERQGRAWEAWRCPGMPGLPGCGDGDEEEGDEGGEGDEEDEQGGGEEGSGSDGEWDVDEGEVQE